MSRDCDLPQSKADDVDANCEFVIMEDIKKIVEEQIEVLNARPKRNIGEARAKLQAISHRLCLPFLTLTSVAILMVFLAVVHSSASAHG